MPNQQLFFSSTEIGGTESGKLISIDPQKAHWDLISFCVRQLAQGDHWRDQTSGQECCLVLLKGKCRIRWDGEEHILGPRANVFESYPHAAYLPAGTEFQVMADELCELADGRAPSEKKLKPRLISPQECGFEIRGGGNATRQIVDIMPPEFPADRLLVCEVYTPSGNWSSYPPHKHDQNNPPEEAKLEETYYYRFLEPEAYGLQRLYTSDADLDELFKVSDGDLVLIPRGYHPFVTAYGYHAYYLNFLAGGVRSMAASDDPEYVQFRHSWPAPDSRLPLVERPVSVVEK